MLTTLQKKIYKHCPDLKELTLGCEVWLMKPDGYLKHTFITELFGEYKVLCEIGDNACMRSLPKDEVEPVGHPIQLHHVMRAMGEYRPFYLHPSGFFLELNGPEPMTMKHEWDITKNLSGQSPETIEWLNNLIQ